MHKADHLNCKWEVNKLKSRVKIQKFKIKGTQNFHPIKLSDYQAKQCLHTTKRVQYCSNSNMPLREKLMTSPRQNNRQGTFLSSISKILQASIQKRTQLTGNKQASRQNRVISSFKTKQNKPFLNQTPLSSIHQPVSLFAQQNTGMDVKLLGKKSQSRKWEKLLSLINYMLSSSDKAVKYISSSNFEAEFAVKLFKSDKENLINELKNLDLQELANEIRGVNKSNKDTVSRELYNQLFDENIKLKKEIVLLEKEAECFHSNSNLLTRELLLTEPANHNSSQFNASLAHKLNSSSAKMIEASDFEKLIKQLVEEKGFKKLQQIMVKEKKFESMLGKCKQGDKKVTELNQILTALYHQKQNTFCSSLKQPIFTEVQKNITKSLSSEVAQSSRSVLKMRQIHQQKQILQNQIQNLKQQLEGVKNIDKIDKENILLKKNHQLLYEGLNQILTKINPQFLLIDEDESNQTKNDKGNVIIRIQEYISRKQNQSLTNHQTISLLNLQKSHLTQAISQLQQERQSLHQSLQNHKNKTAQHLTQYKQEIQRLNNAIQFLQTSESKTLASQQITNQSKIAQLEKSLLETESKLQQTEEREKYSAKRFKDLQEQLFVKEKLLKEKKELLQENEQCEERLKQKFEHQLNKQSAKYQQLSAILSQSNKSLMSLEQRLLTSETYSKGLEDQITQTTHKLNLYEQKISQLEQTIEDLECRLQLSVSDRQASQQSHILMVEGLNLQMSDYRIENLRLVDVVTGLERELKEVRNQRLVEANEVFSEKVQTIKKLETDLNLLSEQNAQIVKDKCHLVQLLNKATNQKQQINSQLLSIKDHIKQLQTANNTLLNDNTNLFNDKQSLQIHLSNLEAHLNHVQNNFKAQTQQLLDQKLSLSHQVQALVKCLEQVKGQNQMLSVQRSSSQTEKHSLMQELSEKLQEQKHNYHLITQQHKNSTAQMKALLERQAKSLQVQEQMTRRVQVLQEQLRLSFSKLSASHKQKQFLMESLNEAQSRVIFIQQTQRTSLQQLEDVRSQLQASQNQVGQVSQTYEEMMQQRTSQVQSLKEAFLNQRRQFEGMIQQANSDLQRVSGECELMKTQLSGISELRMALEEQLAEKHNQNEVIRRQLAHARQQLNLANQSSQLSASQSLINQLTQQTSSLNQQIQTLNFTTQHLQQQNATLTHTNTVLQQQLASLQISYEQQSAQLNSLDHDYKQLDEELATSMTLFEQIKTSLETQKENAQMLTDLNDQIKLQHQGEMTALENQLQHEKLKNLQLQTQISSLIQQSQLSTHDRTMTQSLKLHYETSLSQTHQQIASLNQELQHSKQQLSALNQSELSLKDQLTQKDALISTLQIYSSHLLQQLNVLSQQLSKAQMSNQELSSQLIFNKQAFEELNRHIISVRQELEQATEKNESLQRKITKTTNELDSTKLQCESLKSQSSQQQKIEQPQPNPSIHQMKLQQYVVLLKKILQSTSIEFDDLKDETSLDVLLEKGCQRIVKMKRQMRDEESNRKKLNSERESYSYRHDRLLVVNQEDVQIEAFNEEDAELETERHFAEQQKVGHSQIAVGQVRIEDLPVTRLFQSQVQNQVNQQSTSQKQSSKSHKSQQNMSDFGDIDQTNMSKSQISISDQQQLNRSQFINSHGISTQSASLYQPQRIAYPSQNQFLQLETHSKLPEIQKNDAEQKPKGKDHNEDFGQFQGSNHIDDFNEVQSDKINSSFLSQKPLNQPQPQKQLITTADNPIMTNNSQIKSDQSQKLQQFDNFDDFKQSQSLNASMLSEKAQNDDNVLDNPQLNITPKDHQNNPIAQKNSKVLDDLEGFADYASQQMNESILSQEQQKPIEDLDRFADYASEKMSQSMLSQKENEERSLDDLDGFADYASQKMNQSMISHKQDIDDDQPNPFSDRKDPKDNQKPDQKINQTTQSKMIWAISMTTSPKK